MNRKEFVKEISKLNPSSTFLSISGYRNEYGELSDYSIVFNISYANALSKSYDIIFEFKPNSDLEKQARNDLLKSFKESLDKINNLSTDEVVGDNYIRFTNADGNYIKNVKMHVKTGDVYISGLLVFKKIIIPGTYQKVEHKPLTVVKNELRKLCPVNKFRQFKMNPIQVNSIQIRNVQLLPPVK